MRHAVSQMLEQAAIELDQLSHYINHAVMLGGWDKFPVSLQTRKIFWRPATVDRRPPTADWLVMVSALTKLPKILVCFTALNDRLLRLTCVSAGVTQ